MAKTAVVQAENLANKEGMFGGKNDPYCVVSLAGSTQSFKTKVKKEAGSACLWEESTQVGIPAAVVSRRQNSHHTRPSQTLPTFPGRITQKILTSGPRQDPRISGH
jgi:hypothetical protein